MDKAFHDAMEAGYALTEPGLVLGSPMVDGELFNDARHRFGAPSASAGSGSFFAAEMSAFLSLLVM